MQLHASPANTSRKHLIQGYLSTPLSTVENLRLAFVSTPRHYSPCSQADLHIRKTYIVRHRGPVSRDWNFTFERIAYPFSSCVGISRMCYLVSDIRHQTSGWWSARGLRPRDRHLCPLCDRQFQDSCGRINLESLRLLLVVCYSRYRPGLDASSVAAHSQRIGHRLDSGFHIDYHTLVLLNRLPQRNHCIQSAFWVANKQIQLLGKNLG